MGVEIVDRETGATVDRTITAMALTLPTIGRVPPSQCQAEVKGWTDPASLQAAFDERFECAHERRQADQ